MRLHGCPGTLILPLLLVSVGAVTNGCAKDRTVRADAAASGGTPNDPLTKVAVPQSKLRLTSPAFDANAAIPDGYTCHGSNVSPPLDISGVPADTKSLVLVVDDPDAPDPAAPARDWIHWIVFNLAPTTTNLPEALATLPTPALAGLNDWNQAAYGGPCPPIGRHRYYFRIYALDQALDMTTPTLSELRNAAQGHVLGSASLMGTCSAN